MKTNFNVLKYLMFSCVLLLISGVSSQSKSLTTQKYIDSFKDAAMQEMRVYGIPASITLGQGILESASGNSRLCKECNNHFGIKCRKNWEGKYCLADDDAKDECFRGYENANESYRDHSLFLKNSRRYASLFELPPTDYENWAHGLRKAGYATNPAYGNILIRVIEKYRLSLYDSIVVLGNEYLTNGPGKVINVNGLPAVAARAGDNVENLAKENDLAQWRLCKYNDLEGKNLINPGEILYLKPKRNKGIEKTHIIKRGETLHDISQMHAVKLKSLRKLNKLKDGQEPAVGEEINLQDRRKTPPKIVIGDVPMSNVKKIFQIEKKLDSNTYEVQKNETIESIANKFNISVLNIVRWNDMEFAEVKEGQILILAPGVKSSSEVRSAVSDDQELKPRTHTVIKGETIFSIARNYGIDAQTIISANPQLQNGGQLLADQVISLIPSLEAESSAISQKPSIHYVKPGETLYALSIKYGVSVDEMKSLNGLENNSIWVGQKLKLK